METKKIEPPLDSLAGEEFCKFVSTDSCRFFVQHPEFGKLEFQPIIDDPSGGKRIFPDKKIVLRYYSPEGDLYGLVMEIIDIKSLASYLNKIIELK